MKVFRIAVALAAAICLSPLLLIVYAVFVAQLSPECLRTSDCYHRLEGLTMYGALLFGLQSFPVLVIISLAWIIIELIRFVRRVGL
jgi:hypothetical protein